MSETEMADFIASVMDYLPKDQQKTFQQILDALREQHPIAPERLAEAARTIAFLTWPARRALDRFTQTVGAEQEWDALFSALRPSTAAALKKLKKGTDEKTVSAALNSADAAILIHEEEETEIRMARPRVRLDLWQAHKKNLAPFLKEAAVELEGLKKRFEKMRATAERTPREEEMIRTKLEEYEYRVLFKGEMIPLEILDQEIGFDIDDAEIPPEDY